jgi:hypothetical protein
MWRSVTWLVAATAAVGAATAQPAPHLIGGASVAPHEIEAHPAVRSLRAAFPACRAFDAVQAIRAKIDRGPDATPRDDVFALVSADCRRGRTQFLYLGIDRGADEPEPVVLTLFPQPIYAGLAYDAETRRLYGRLARPDRLAELPWQRFARTYLAAQQVPLADYAGLFVPPVPAGPVPTVAAIVPPPDPTVALRARLEAELRPTIEREIRERLRGEVRQELFAEVQARLDRAREIVVGLERDLADARGHASAARDEIGRIRAEAAEARAALGRSEAARQTAERALESERTQRTAALGFADEARLALAAAQSEIARLEAEVRRLAATDANRR